MLNFDLICGHCGTEHSLQVASPNPAHEVTCAVCGHSGQFEDWAASTERELSAQTDARIHDVSRRR